MTLSMQVIYLCHPFLIGSKLSIIYFLIAILGVSRAFFSIEVQMISLGKGLFIFFPNVPLDHVHGF